jgi:hypothetical protein
MRERTFGMKTIFGDQTRARGFEGQAAELLILRCVEPHDHLGIPNRYAM